MSLLSAVSAYRDRYLRAGGTDARTVRAWLDTEVSPEDAVRLEAKGHTPQAVAAEIAAAPVRWDDERDAEAVIDRLLLGPAI
ncbi:hypothetical protein C1I95_14825 [Micromonospora craterilacus]|uniref:Uncharacterized protein n=1 Tax=Micromonospora craterilacus TaxID=1655439 RepID=A0A2W2EW84_9ACTN|nr:hypothetical protein [Micromonospora craterilacus]PZG17820.1 hypothetical protein C1I95_14825 [Micromonospora craterilacus]